VLSSILPGRLLWVFIGLALGWGCNWPMMKIALTEMGPLHFRALCLLIGAAGVFAAVFWQGLPWRVPRTHWSWLVLIAMLNFAVWNVCAAYGIRMLSSGRAVILAYTMPVWGVLLGAWILDEPLTARRLAGLALGLGGMGLLVIDEIAMVGRAPLGAILILTAALVWAFGLVVMKRRKVDVPASTLTAWQMLVAGTPILVGALVLEDSSFRVWEFSPAAAWAATYTIVVGFVFCQWAWIKIALVAPVAVSSILTLAVPVVGVMSSVLIAGEQPAWADVAALLAVVAAIGIVLSPGAALAARAKI